jgi:hypothetical protein
VQTKLQDLKTVIRQKIERKLNPQHVTVGAGLNEPLRVYLICDQMDDAEVEPLANHLFDQRIEVILPLRDEDRTEVKQFHTEQLRICDGVLIYYGQAKSSWMMTNLNELRKLPAYRDPNRLPAKSIFIGGQPTPHKESFRTLEATVIKRYGDFSPDAIAPFIEQVRKTRQGQ